MRDFKYTAQSLLKERKAPLITAMGLALGASSLQAATITVTTLDDGSVPGQCTLRDALNAAYTDAPIAGCTAGSGDDEIVFQGGLSGTITLSGGQLPISSNITITGPGAGQLTISGDNSSRVLYASGGSISEVRGLRLANGYANDTPGGAAAVVVNATLTLADCQVSNNSSGPNAYGGAITASFATLTIDNCVINANSVVGGMAPRGGGASNAFGGGVLAVNSQLAVNNSYFLSNSAGSYGGSLALVSTTATISSSGFVANEALIGGGISVGDGSQLTLQNSYVTDNLAGGGGGIAVGSTGYALVDSSDLYGNDAAYFGGGAQVGRGYSAPAPLAEPERGETVFGAPNFSLIGPGTLNTVNAYVAVNNSLETAGGIGAKYGSMVTLSTTEIAYNEAMPPVVIPRSGSLLGNRGGSPFPEGRGGGLASLDGSYIEGYEVNLRNNTAVYGGGGYANEYGELFLANSIVSNNSANIGGGLLGGFFESVVMPRDDDERGGLPPNDGSVGVYDSLVANNAAAYGAGIAAIYGGLASVKYSTVAENTASGFGGGVLSYGSVLLSNRSTISNNQADAGAGISARLSPGSALIARSTISNNVASSLGGGLDIRNVESQIKYSTVSGNSASTIGGVVMIGTPVDTVGLLNSTVTDNTADLVGGIYAENALIDFATISHNTSNGVPMPRQADEFLTGVTDNPGGLYVRDGVQISNTILSNNVSPGDTIDLTVADMAAAVQVDYTLIQTPGQGIPMGVGNLSNVDPQLGLLAANGGFTATRAIGPGSPALDVGDPATTVPNDQRGAPFVRVFNGRADMGAFEFIIDGIFDDRFEQP